MAAPAPAVTDAELSDLDERLAALPAPLEPLDASALDGYLAGVLVQPQRIEPARWLAHVHDVDGRPAPAGVELARIQALAVKRHRQLDAAIERRVWFDPWVFTDDADAPGADEGDTSRAASQAVLPWVAGFATAMHLFPELERRGGAALAEPLALLYRHLDPADLEDAESLRPRLEEYGPPADLADAVDDLVRATLLLADLTRPRPAVARAPRRARRT